MDGPLLVQQFGERAQAALQQQVSAPRVVTGAPGPSGWRLDCEILLAAPTKHWRGQPRPGNWPGRTRWIQLPSTGIDGYPDWLFDVPCVTTAPSLHAQAIAEFVLTSLLAFAKHMPQAWVSSADAAQPRPMGTLRGQTLALAGIGAIGSEVARLALAFGMRVLALRRTAAPLRDDLARHVDVVTDRLALAAAADHLVLALPATPQTHHLVDADFLAACRPGIHIVNVARGELIDQSALLRSLDNATVARASLDVTSPEPLPQAHPFYTHPRVLLTPHVAWQSPGGLDRLLAFFVDQLARYTTGQTPRHITQPSPTHHHASADLAPQVPLRHSA